MGLREDVSNLATLTLGGDIHFDVFIYYLYDSCYRFCSVSRKTWEHIYFFLEFIPQMRGASIPWARSSISSRCGCGCRRFWDTCACLWLISFPCYLPVFPFFTLDFLRFSYFSIMSQPLTPPTGAKSVLCTISGNTVEDAGLRLHRATSSNILSSPKIWPWHEQRAQFICCGLIRTDRRP